MALRNFCMDGASSFASGTVVAQMIDPSCSVVLVTVELHICRLFVCLFVCRYSIYLSQTRNTPQ